MNRKEILDAADAATGRDRNNSYGPAERNFEAIAALWNFWLEGRIVMGNHITAYDVAQMMSLLKKARARGNRRHADNFVDDVGYTALAGDLAGADCAERQGAGSFRDYESSEDGGPVTTNPLDDYKLKEQMYRHTISLDSKNNYR